MQAHTYSLGALPTTLSLQEPIAAVYDTSSEAIARIRGGIGRDDLMEFSKESGRSLRELSRILPVSYSLLTKRDHFGASVTEHLLALTRLFRRGRETFGTIERFNSWLDTPAPQLHGQRGFDMLDTFYGIHQIEAWVHRIDHGMPV